jgi:hypothetical protein
MAATGLYYRDASGERHPISQEWYDAISTQRLKFDTIEQVRAHFRQNPARKPRLLGGVANQVASIPATA